MEEVNMVERFESGAISGDNFHHEDHVKLAWAYLQAHALPDALAQMTRGLKRFAQKNGVPERYHETMTWAYMFIIHERIVTGGREQTWAEFADRNRDLIDGGKRILDRYYESETLSSDIAKRFFLLPDKLSKSS
jgi:hypothetical protein